MKQKTLVVLTLACLLLTAGAVAAQVEPAPFITVHYDRIDPSQTMAYEANAKQWVEAFSGAKLGQEFYWRAYQSGFSYAWVSDLANYAALDKRAGQNEMVNEKIGKEKMAELSAGGSAPVVEHYNEIWKYEPEMSYIPAGFDPAGMGAISVGVTNVRPSMGKEYRELVVEAIAALRKIEAPINFFGYSVQYGAGSYAFVSWGEDRAGLHSGPEMGNLLTEAVGAEKAQEMLTRYLNCVSADEDRDWRVRADLAYLSDGEMMAKEEAKEEPAE